MPAGHGIALILGNIPGFSSRFGPPGRTTMICDSTRGPVGVFCPCYCPRVAMKPEIHASVSAQSRWLIIWWYPPTLLPLGAMLMWVACVALCSFNEGRDWVSSMNMTGVVLIVMVWAAKVMMMLEDLAEPAPPPPPDQTVTLWWPQGERWWHLCGMDMGEPTLPFTGLKYSYCDIHIL